MTTAIDLPEGFGEREVRVEQVRLVYARIRDTQWAMLGLALVVALVFRADGWGIAAWLMVQVGLKAVEFVELRWFATDAMIAARPEAMARRLAVTQALHAAAWTALAAVTLPHASPTTFVLVFLTMAGISSGSVTAFAPLLGVFTAYIVVEIGLLVAILLLGRSAVPPGFTPLFIAIFGGAMWAKARGEAAESRRTIVLAFANQAVSARLEREVERSRAAHGEAVAANLAKSRFLAAASHDLRQPLHALGLFLGILDRSVRGAVQTEAVANARAAAAASSEMLDALLDFSRADAGVIAPRPRPFFLDEVLGRLEREMAPLAEAKGLSWRTRPTDLAVESDPALVQMILLNLGSNAVRYTERGGVLMGCRRRDDRAVVEVWDTGIGIPPEQVEAVFEEFHQLGNPERDRHKGLGLGLAIARRLAELIGAELSLASRPGRGSVFRLSLPVASSPPVAAGAGRLAETPAPTGLRILVIDDDEAIRSGMRQLLESSGHACDAVETIEQGLERARAARPGLMLCDFRLRGGRTGAEAVAAIRQALGGDIPAILITGDTQPERLTEAECAGLSVLHKPVSAEALEAAIRKAAGQN